MTKRTILKRLNRVIGFASDSVFGYCTRLLWQDARCVFVLSTGRTGTATLMFLLNLSEEIQAYHEPRPQLMDERKRARAEVYSNRDKFARIFVRARAKPLYQAKRNGKIYGETSARLTFFAPVIAELMPNARFIYIHRDPVDVIRSGMRRGWYVDHPADFARIAPVPGEAYYSDWKDWDPFTKICWYWDAYNRFALHFCEHVDPSRLLTISAEDIFDGSAVPRIFDLLHLTAPPTSQIKEVLRRKINAQTTSGFPLVENWNTDMKQTLERLAGDVMRCLGYPPYEQVESQTT